MSILIACVIGLILGILVSEYRRSSSLVFGIVNFIYTIPSISLLGFLIPFSGIGNTTAIIVLTVYALLPMVRNTYTGIEGIDPAVIEAATGMGSTRGQMLWRIKLPLALPAIITGLRNMAVMTIALAGIASFIGAGGLGVAIYRSLCDPRYSRGGETGEPRVGHARRRSGAIGDAGGDSRTSG